MNDEEGHELYSGDRSEQDETTRIHEAVFPETLWTNLGEMRPKRPWNPWLTWSLRRRVHGLSLALVLSILGTALYFFAWDTKNSSSGSWQNMYRPSNQPHLLDSPFTGAFARFPRISALLDRQRRLTMISVWNGDRIPTYMRHYLYTMQMNADVLDLLLINRLPTESHRCLDFEKAGINITWGGNVKVHCMNNSEFKRRHIDFVCSSEYGWDCNSTEYEEVSQEFQQREDPGSFHWTPLRGYVFRDLFDKPNNPLWAWLDLDILLGNFARYPFNVLSQVSLLTGVSGDEPLFLAGQLTAFNLDDQALGSAWKKFPEMKSPSHFTKYINGRMPESADERYWSYGYLRTDEDLPGSELSYGIYPDIHGDDYYDHVWNRRNAAQVYLVSGRDVLLTSLSSTREEIQGMIQMERNDPIDDLGGIGWTEGEDGSGYLLDQPSLGASEAKRLAIADAERLHGSARVHNGIVEDKLIVLDCLPKRWTQCVPPHPLTISNPPLMRTSLLRLREQTTGHILRRLERDDRPRGYERKLFKHHQKLKKLDWFELPPFDITEDLVLRYNFDFVEVFKMGSSRNETLFYRKKGAKSIG